MENNERLDDIVQKLCESREQQRDVFNRSNDLPNPNKLEEFIVLLRNILWPGFYDLENILCKDYESALLKLIKRLKKLVQYALQFECDADTCDSFNDEVEKITLDFMASIPEIQRLLLLDLEAMFHGDPAANSRQEILLAYPSFQAIMIQRSAHVLHRLDVPFLPRMMTEYAHMKTGIDIHPGATIGEYFFIDHGTGVVIGETCEIGDHVKVYQGVTLGALSLQDGRDLHGSKRHPSIGNHVTLYANCTVLGGETIIGEGVTIGGGAFVTKSVEAGKKVYMKIEIVEA